MKTKSCILVLAGSFALPTGCAGYDGEDVELSTDTPLAAQQTGATQGVPAPPGVKFTKAEAFGSGCPENTPGTTDSYYFDFSPEGDAFTVEFYKFRTNVSPSDTRPDNSLSCTMRIGFAVPSGYSYTITDIVYEGQSNLPQGVTANFVTSYGYQGSGQAPVSVTHVIKSPSTLQQFKFRDALESTAGGSRWSTCGGSQVLNVNMAIQVRNPTRKLEGWAELSYGDGEVRTTRDDPNPSQLPGVSVKLAWKKCP